MMEEDEKTELEERHCAYCGNLLEPDEGHSSEIYAGELCDFCYELEPG